MIVSLGSAFFDTQKAITTPSLIQAGQSTILLKVKVINLLVYLDKVLCLQLGGTPGSSHVLYSEEMLHF